MQYSDEVYNQARISKDARFDGKFFVAVKTTGIYCRPICPATTPRRENITFFPTAIEAANAGYRPCLRCRPDSAPNSPAWQGVNTTLDRALNLIDQGALQGNSLEHLAERLGVGSRHLRQIFKKNLGISPKAYELYQKCLFAKKLLHQTSLPITQVAMASGFNSIRRFNDCFQSQLNLTPTQVRKTGKNTNSNIELQLYYRPPYHWPFVRDFLKFRLIPELEWCDEQSYGRSFVWHDQGQDCYGSFTAEHMPQDNGFNIHIELDDASKLRPVVNNIRRILDLDVDIQGVDHNLKKQFKSAKVKNSAAYEKGIRLPGIWNVFESGVRAILGQQVSVKAAHGLCATLVCELGLHKDGKRFFPSPEAIAASDLDFLKMPGSRKDTLRNLANHFLQDANAEDPAGWIELKGIGPWTVEYAKMRGQSQPDIFLAKDLGVINAIKSLGLEIDPDSATPWRSYLTLQLWNQL